MVLQKLQENQQKIKNWYRNVHACTGSVTYGANYTDTQIGGGTEDILNAFNQQDQNDSGVQFDLH